MMLFDLIELKKDQIARMGELEIAAARQAGVPAVYMDPVLGSGLVREMPDGTRELFERRAGKIVVLQKFGPREPK